jgi:hypothetical protein
MANDPNALTNMWMTNPWMFDPTQNSNQFANPAYINQALPFPPTYNTGPAGGPTNAMGQPIASFQAWQAANPGGTTINATPAQPQAAPASAPPAAGLPSAQQSALGQWGPAINEMMTNAAAAQAAMTPQQRAVQAQNDAMRQQMLQQQATVSAVQAGNGGFGNMQGGAFNSGSYAPMQPQAQPAQQPAAAAPASGGGAPNNWYAALNALANPGNPVTQGATVPMASGFQPAGGVNQAFLGQAGAGNPNFLSALSAIQRRPQGVA